MGKIRARTDAELAARKREILDAAAEQLMTEDYDAITLATIAEKTSISRASILQFPVCRRAPPREPDGRHARVGLFRTNPDRRANLL